MAIKTVLFDLDGTLINTNPLIIKSFLHVLENNFPGQYTEADVYPFIGPSLRQTFTKLDESRVDELIEQYQLFNRAHHDELVEEYEGVYQTIKTLHERGFKLGIVTTKMRKTVNMGIKLAQLDNFFDVVVTLDDVTNCKPDPEPIQLAMNHIQADPETTLMVGDNYHDILGGKNAGVKTAGVAWTIKGVEYLQSFKPDYMIHHMEEILTIIDEENRA